MTIDGKNRMQLMGRLHVMQHSSIFALLERGRWGKVWCCLVAFVLLATFTQAQKVFRRHFIIAQDISAPFLKSKEWCPAFKQALIDLFENDSIQGYQEAFQDNLLVEKSKGIPFFEPDRDEVSFFHFNVARSEFERLRWIASDGNEQAIVEEFCSTFLKDKGFRWSSWKNRKEPQPFKYIHRLDSLPPTPDYFGRGVSMSNLVYPLILNRLQQASYAEEYVLIILSDFLTGSSFGNTRDWERVKEIFETSYYSGSTSKTSTNYIKKKTDHLATQYYKVDFFQYSFDVRSYLEPIGILGYKIKPKVGAQTPEDVALFVDGDLRLLQQEYASPSFTISPATIKFTHNASLQPTGVRMRVQAHFTDRDSILFDDEIASKEENGNWSSSYINNDGLMQFDPSRLTYFLPTFNLLLPALINKQNIELLTFHYELKTTYNVAGVPSLNFIYKTERTLPLQSIELAAQSFVVVLYYIIPIFLFLLLVVVMVQYGKPKSIQLQTNGYLDSFERVDFEDEEVGKLVTPYKAWDKEKQRKDYIVVTAHIHYRWPRYFLNWKAMVHVGLTHIKIPEGFELFLKTHPDDIKEYSGDLKLLLHKQASNTLRFVVGIRQNDVSIIVEQPEIVEFTVQATARNSWGVFKTIMKQSLRYNFHIGPELHGIWMGIDPGTSGSCITVGSNANNIVIGQDRMGNKIVPSIVVFDRSEDITPNNQETPEGVYYSGTAAAALASNKRKYHGFQSIKKLLGYTDEQQVEFKNGASLALSGKQLAGLLVRGLYRETKPWFTSASEQNKEYLCGTPPRFSPKRAVVAIPNNFTTRKIQDMVDCVAALQQFKEIRYVYEAEAVLFYYLSNYKALTKTATPIDSENVLVFDMGGATINATVVTINRQTTKESLKYNVDLQGKIGYGIGGDAIDYCTVKAILENTEEFPALAGVDITEQKSELLEMARKIKHELVRTYYETTEENLIGANQLEEAIEKGTGCAIEVQRVEEVDDDEGESVEKIVPTAFYRLFKRLPKKGCLLLQHPLFTNIIYNNVKDAVQEVIHLSGNIHIDKVLFSGRSTAFPLIKEEVKKQLWKADHKPAIIALDIEASKTAVAKGACWYGINKSMVQLNNHKTNAAFGYKKTLSADKTDVQFFELVGMGQAFDVSKSETGAFEGTQPLVDDFASDGNKVEFYQIMGKDANEILSRGQQHKFSKVATIALPQKTKKLAMKVNGNDAIECVVALESGQALREKGVVADQEIKDANEEHYTWVI